MGPMALEPNGFSSHHWYWVENWWAPQRTNLSGFHSEQNALQPYFEGWKTCSGGMLFFLRNNMCQAILKTWGEQYVTKTLMTNPTIREANWVTNWSMRCWILASNRTWSYHLVSCDWPKKQLMEWRKIGFCRTWEKNNQHGPPNATFPARKLPALLGGTRKLPCHWDQLPVAQLLRSLQGGRH